MFRGTKLTVRRRSAILAASALVAVVVSARLAGKLAAEDSNTDRLGDPLPPGAIARLGTTRLRQGGVIHHLAYSPDGKLLASVSYDLVRIWDAAAGRLVRTFAGADAGNEVAFSPDGRTLAVANGGYPVLLFDPATGARLARLVDEDGASTLAFSPDGKRLAAAARSIRIWNLATREVVRETPFLEDYVWAKSASFSPDGKRVLLTANGIAYLHDPEKGEVRAACGAGDPAIFSPDGKTIATLSKTEGTETVIRLWNVEDGKRTAELGGYGTILSIAYSPDGKTIAAGYQSGDIGLWDMASHEETRTIAAHLRGEGRGVSCLAFSPDGKRIASSRGETVRFHDVASGEESPRIEGHESGVGCVAFAPGATEIASSGGDRRVRIWDLATRRERACAAGYGELAFSRDGKDLVAVSAHSRQASEPKARIEHVDPAKGAAGDSVEIDDAGWPVAVSASGEEIACVGSGVVRIFDRSGRELRSLPVGAEPKSLAFSDDGSTFAVGTPSALFIWAKGKGEEARTLGEERCCGAALALSRDGKLVAYGSEFPDAVVLDAASGKRICVVEHDAVVDAIAFSHDARTLATGSADKTIRLWDVATGAELRRFRPDECSACLAFSPDDALLVSGDRAGTVLVFETRR